MRAASFAYALALAACGPSDAPGPRGSAAPAASSAPVVAAASAIASAPDVVTRASDWQPAEPTGPSVVGEGSVDGAALRKRHVERLKADKSPVVVHEGASALELGRSICEAVVPRRPAATPVLLKPNICGFDSVKDPVKSNGDDGVVGRTTDPEFTRGVIRCLKARGHTAITVAEGCAFSHAYWQKVARLTGYVQMAAQEGVKLVALDDDGVFDKEGDKPGEPLAIKGIGASRVPTLLLPRALAEHLDRGLFISLPKVKAHRFSVVSLGIKGMQGTVMLSDARPAYTQKHRMHRELKGYLESRKDKPEDPAERATKDVADRKLYLEALAAFAERMVDVLEISTPDAVLADGAPAMGGDGFQKLWPSAEKFAIGGTNPVLVDRVGSQLLGLWDVPRLGAELGGHRSSPLITAAAKRFGLSLKDKDVEVTGSGKHLLASPRVTHFKAMAPFEIHGDGAAPWSPVAPVYPEVAPAPTPTPPPEPPARATTATATAHAVALGADAITVDGKPDDAAWAKATPVAWETDYAGAATGVTTRARFAWSKSALYALFELAGAGLHTDTSQSTTTERKGLYQEDCVELFLTPDASDKNHYFEIEVGPFGHWFDLDVRKGGKSDTAWSSRPRIATTRDASARTAVIELALESVEITSKLAAGAKLPMGLYRMEGASPRKYLAWSPPKTAKPNFHVPDAFGQLVLDP